MNGVSTEYIEAREDEIAQLITANEHIDKLRALASILHKRNIVSDAYFSDIQDSLAYIGGALLVGKRNTSALRNSGRP